MDYDDRNQLLLTFFPPHKSGIILDMHMANESRCYIVTPPLIGWAPTQNDPW